MHIRDCQCMGRTSQECMHGGPNGTRTRVSALRGPRPRPLDDGAMWPERQKNRAYYIGKVNRRATKNQEGSEGAPSLTFQSERRQYI